MATKTKDRTATEVYDFTYKARKADGKRVVGKASAKSKMDVTKELAERGLVPLSVKGGPGDASQSDFTYRKQAKHRSLVVVTRMLSTLYKAGLPPLEAIKVVITDCEDPVLRDALIEVQIQMRQGVKMSAAMATQSAFPPGLARLVRAGESEGDLAPTFERIAKQYDAEDQLRAKIKKAAMYPIILTVMSGLVFAFMMFFLVPKFTDAFLELGGEDAKLPALTQFVVDISHVMKLAAPILLVVAVPTLIWYSRHRHDEKVRMVVDPWKLKIPVIGNLFHQIALTRFCQTLSGLLMAGVNPIEALDITAGTVGNIKLEKATLEARDQQRMGKALIEPLRAEPLFPTALLSLVAAGEATGQTGEMLGNAVVIYERQVDLIADNLTTLIQPILLVILAVMIGTIVISIYLPYLSLMTMI